MNIESILQNFQRLHPKYISLDLERITQLLSDLGDPHLSLPPTIHVAGTNGKGSTISFLKYILEESKLKVHTYTSPHLVHFNERIRLNGDVIKNKYLFETLLEVEKKNQNREITFFEITTALAFLIFSRIRADFLLLEVGLGGRLDATNVLPEVDASIITLIDYDHEHFLGNNLKNIAVEKSGIIKKNCPVFTFNQKKEVLEVIIKQAKSLNAPLYILDKNISRIINKDGSQTINIDKKNYFIPPPSLFGSHQIDNAALASSCAIIISQKFRKRSFKCLLGGVSKVKWPGRTQQLFSGKLVTKLIHEKPRVIILDGAHNKSGSIALSNTLKNLHNGKWLLLFGYLKTRNPEDFLKIMRRVSDKIITIKIPNQKEAFSEIELSKIASNIGFNSTPAYSINDSINKIKDIDLPICICGSLYLVGKILKENETIPS